MQGEDAPGEGGYVRHEDFTRGVAVAFEGFVVRGYEKRVILGLR